MLQPEINQNTTLKWHQVSNIKSTMVGFWLDFGCLTSQPDFNHGTTLKSGCVPSGYIYIHIYIYVVMSNTCIHSNINLAGVLAIRQVAPP